MPYADCQHHGALAIGITQVASQRHQRLLAVSRTRGSTGPEVPEDDGCFGIDQHSYLWTPRYERGGTKKRSLAILLYQLDNQEMT